MPNKEICGEKSRHGEMDTKGVDDRHVWAHGKGSVGGETQGQIKERERQVESE